MQEKMTPKITEKQRKLRAEQMIADRAYLEFLGSKISLSDYTWVAIRTLAWQELVQLQSESYHPYQGCYEDTGQCFCIPILGWLFLSKHAGSHILEWDQANSELRRSCNFFSSLYYIIYEISFLEKQIRQEK